MGISNPAVSGSRQRQSHFHGHKRQAVNNLFDIHYIASTWLTRGLLLITEKKFLNFTPGVKMQVSRLCNRPIKDHQLTNQRPTRFIQVSAHQSELCVKAEKY